MKNTYLKSVGEFHELFQMPSLSEPEIVNERIDLRVNLIQEELDELKDALKAGDLVETADALGDILYVVFGAIHEFGLKDKIDAIFDDIHASNMSKGCSSMAEAEATVEHYKGLGVESYIVERGNKFLVYRTEDKKALKSINYKPVKIEL